MKQLQQWMDTKWIAIQNGMCRKSEGMGTVEIILIICCLVGVVIIFKEQITELVESIFSKITTRTNKI